MNDLLIAVVALLSLSIALAVSTFYLAGRLSDPSCTTLTIVLVALTALFAALLHGRLVMARLVPLSGAIVLGNWVPLGLALAIGLWLGRKSIAVWRRLLISAALAAVAIFSVIQPFIGARSSSGADTWAEGVLLQSDRAACSPAAASTLLRAHGVNTSEREMARLSLTNRRGTPVLGLYRGLKLKAAESQLRVVPLHASVDALLAADRWPALLLVRLDHNVVDPRYENEWGWTPGVGHVVVVFGRVGDDRIDVGDPSVGRERWTIDDLHVLWHGEGICLERE